MAVYRSTQGLWVDGTNGVDARGIRGRSDRPFKTIQAAINAAVANDVVYIHPGTYSEVIVCKDDVSVQGLPADHRRVVISRAAAATETVVTMAERMALVEIDLNLAPTGGTTTGILFGGTSNATSFLRFVQVIGTAGNVLAVHLNGTGVTTPQRQNLNQCALIAFGTGRGILKSGTGTANVVGTRIDSPGTGEAVRVEASTLNLWNCRLTGTVGLRVLAGATANLDRATRVSAYDNQGTLTQDLLSFPRDNFTASVNPTTADDKTKGYDIGSFWFNTTTKTFFQAASVATGAAVWNETPSGSTLAPILALGRESPGEHFLGQLLDYGASGGHSASEIQYTRVYLTAGLLIDEMRFYVDTGGGGGVLVRLGIYDQVDPTLPNSNPNNKVAETGANGTTNGAFNGFALTTPGGGVYTVPVSGYYWVAIITDNTAIKFAVTNIVYRAGFLPVRRQAGTGVTLPATASGLSNPTSALTYASAVEQGF